MDVSVIRLSGGNSMSVSMAILLLDGQIILLMAEVIVRPSSVKLLCSGVDVLRVLWDVKGRCPWWHMC